MPVAPDTASLVVSIVSGVLKLGGRVDRILAEEEAVRSELAIRGPTVVSPPPALPMRRALEELLEAPVPGGAPDPLGEDRAEMRALVDRDDPSQAELLRWMEAYLPEEIEYRIDDPDGRFLRRLEERRPAWGLDDEDIRNVALLVGPGGDRRGTDLGWRLSLVTLDSLAEFGARHTRLLVDDNRARPVVESVLRNFADEDLERIGSWSGLFTHVLGATLNGAIDARQSLANDKAWLTAVLDALASSREAAGAGDDYVVGLVRGRGYAGLVEALLDQGATRLGADAAGGFEAVAAAVLRAAAPLAAGSPSFEAFFEAHWGDLLTAGLGSLHRLGPSLLDGADPVLRTALLALVGRLAEAPPAEGLSREVLVTAVEDTVLAVATAPELRDAGALGPWVGTLLDSVTDVVADDGLRGLAGPDGLETLVRDALEELGRRPELLIREPGLLRELLGGVLREVARVPVAGIEDLVRATGEGALAAVAENPHLVGTAYPRALGHLSRSVAQGIADGSVHRLEAASLVRHAAAAVVNGREVLVDGDPQLAGDVVSAVLDALGRGPEALHSTAWRVSLARTALNQLAAHGVTILEERSPTDVVDDVTRLLEDGLEEVARNLGRGLDRETGLLVLEALLRTWGEGGGRRADTADILTEVTTRP